MHKIKVLPEVEKQVISIFGKLYQQYNLYNNMDDSLILYDSPWKPGQPKMVWRIDIGNMPPRKAEDHMREQARKMRRRIDYNPKTGEITKI